MVEGLRVLHAPAKGLTDYWSMFILDNIWICRVVFAKSQKYPIDCSHWHTSRVVFPLRSPS